MTEPAPPAPSEPPGLPAPTTWTTQSPPAASAQPRRRRRWVWLLVVALVVLAILGVWLRRHHAAQAAAQQQQKREPPPVPVVVATAERADVPIVIDGLGTVLAASTVQIRPRVDGPLLSIAVREGDLVAADQVIGQIDPTPYAARLREAEGQLARDQAALRNARADLERFQGGGDVFTRQQLDAQGALVDQDLGVVEADQGAADDARAQLGWCRLTAPIAGRVGLRNVDAGNLVHAADVAPLMTITQEQPIGVVFTIREDDVPRLTHRLASGPAPAVEAWDRDRRAKLADGAVLAVDNLVDVTTGTVRVKAEFGNPDRALFPNQFVNARLILDVVKDAVVVPTTALQRGNGRTYVFVVDDDGAAQMRDVESGPTVGDRTQITTGCAVGDVVIVDGVDRVRPGGKVAPHRAGTSGDKDKGGDKGAARSGGERGAADHAADKAGR